MEGTQESKVVIQVGSELREVELSNIDMTWELSSKINSVDIQFLSHGDSYTVFADTDEAGQAAEERWRDMAAHDPREFTALVGENVLISWALGQPAGPGSATATSLSDWLENVVRTHPEEEFGRYDGAEYCFFCDPKNNDMEDDDVREVVEELQDLAVAYRID